MMPNAADISDDATLAVSRMQVESTHKVFDPFRQSVITFNAAYDRLMSTMGYEDDYEPLPRQRSDAVWKAAVHMEDDPQLAVEAVTGVRCWYDDMKVGEVRILQQWADRMFEDAARNNEGTERMNQLLSASLALTWIAERMEERGSDDAFCSPSAPYLQGEFI
jgi:hypothetical protein